MATITGTSGNDTLTGTSSSDTLVGSGGEDFYDGKAGFDTLDLRATATEIAVDFAAGTISGGFSGTFVEIERVLAGNGDDVLIGGAGAQNLSGRAGADTLEGGAGKDWLWGGGGDDRLVFRETGAANADAVGDFASGSDKIVLDATVMTALGAIGNFSAGDARFAVNASGTAQDVSDRVIYETDTRQIWYDPDGNGAAARELIATLQSGATLVATDIVVKGEDTSSGSATEGDDLLVGTEGNDSIDGLGGNDTIDGLGGDDSLLGGDGDDEITAGGTGDTIDGGAGMDTQISGAGIEPDFEWTIVAASGIEVLILRDYGDATAPSPHFPRSAQGNELDNLIRDEGAGGVILWGGAGNDTMIGGEGDNAFLAPSGIDVIDGGGGWNALVLVGDGGPGSVDFRFGAVTVSGGSATFSNIDAVYGTVADDIMIAGDGAVEMSGDAGDDTLTGGAGDDFLSGDTGFDPTTLAAGDDSLTGGAGDDYLEGLFGTDTLAGGLGADILLGDFVAASAPVVDFFLFDAPAGMANADTVLDFISGLDRMQLDGEAMSALGPSGAFTASDERFFAGAGADSGQDASDRVVYDTSTGEVWYDADGSGAGAAELIATLDGAPALAAIDIEVVNGSAPTGEVINGTSGSDTLTGTSGNDTLNGLGGSDVLGGSEGSDFYDGGAGSDTLDFRAASTGVAVDFGAGTLGGGFDGTFAGIERVLAGNGNDVLIGAAGAQNLSGRAGSDTLEGGAGNDWLWGGGDDDTFIFRETGTANDDDIGDFSSGSDTIALDNAVMAALGAEGAFGAGDDRFFFGAGVSGGADAEDRVVYDTSGALYYDADGSGAGGAELIATLQGAPGLAATDISVI